jgi:hypothetical protein
MFFAPLCVYPGPCCCFSFRVTNVPGQASAGIIQLRNCTMAFLRTALGDLVTPFVLESCLIIHVLLNLQVHTWGMSLASSGKFV